MLVSFLVSPRVGHLHAVMQVFTYLNCHKHSHVVFDSSEFAHPCNAQGVDWMGWYPKAKEAIPPNAPKPLGRGVQMMCYMDANHAGDKLT